MSPSSPAGSSSSTSSAGPTSVLLALPDGPVPPAEAASHTLSFIGGHAAFPRPPPDAVRCGVCHAALPLLAQVYCPLEGGENDRTLYVWACARAGCQRRDGANEEYVRDVAAKRAEAERIAREEKERARVNPFTMNGASSALFGSAQPLFGAPPAPAPPAPPGEPTAPSPPAFADAPDVSALSVSPHTHGPPLPAYQPAQYLSTIDEYLVLPELDDDSDDDDDDDAAAGARVPDAGDAHGEFGGDGWDRLVPRGVDDVFEQFVRRLAGAEDGAAQVVRYDFGGVPLPYSASSAAFKLLFPGAPTQRAADNEDVDVAPFYDPKRVPACARCGAKRVFELQLVPGLISVLRPESLVGDDTAAAATDADAADGADGAEDAESARRRALERLARGDDGGMEWGTVLVFGCARDCVGLGEEWVGVEWEAQAE